ncbi:hypothetical protein GGI07_002142 [Coemansia sp. Benny D115]|nr:hypothetical protein GGI07_002142 [Coemansia sp. Benny D115]
MRGSRFVSGAATAADQQSSSRRASIVFIAPGDTPGRGPTPDQPLLDARYVHSDSLDDVMRPSTSSLTSDSPHMRRHSSTSSAELTEFERAWNQRQRGYQMLALVCALLISGSNMTSDFLL